MKFRNMAAVFLLNEEEEVLFLQKKRRAAFLGGLLVPIGGHIKGDEINEPRKACLREVEEETGLKRECINNLRMKYIVLRIRDNQEIRIQYVFFGNVSKNINLIESDEGSLTWIDYKEIVNHNVSSTTKEKVEHYNELDKSTANVYVG